MIKCYAAGLGGCSNKQSKEHFISKGIWRNPWVGLDGFRWTDGETKILPVLSVASKILCTNHNTALSKLDALFKDFFQTLSRFHDNHDKRRKLKRSEVWKPDRATFDGYELEQLLTKIAIGVIQDGPDVKWHSTGAPAIQPPPIILEVVFGCRDFQPPMGLYAVTSDGDAIVNEDEVTVQTMLDPQTDRFIGAFIAIRHWQFFINLSGLELAKYQMESISGKRIGQNGSEPIYRVKTIDFNARAKLSGRIAVDWGAFKRSTRIP